jgi:tetratricopeptide (TPR) repeat protein
MWTRWWKVPCSAPATACVITAELVDGSNDHHLWAKSYERDARDALGLQNEVAQAIAGEIQVKLTPQEQARLAPARPVNPEAQEAYLRGMYWRGIANHQKSFEYFQQAVEKDPSYAAAWAALSEAYGMMIDAGLMSPKEASRKSGLPRPGRWNWTTTRRKLTWRWGSAAVSRLELGGGRTPIPPGYRVKSQSGASSRPSR